MFSIRNINPMVRAVGTMGAVATLVGGITFASLTSNTVALSPNTLSSATAHLQIGLTNNGGCTDSTDGPKTGMSFTLAPGVTSPNFNFCLKNTGNIPLNITTGIIQSAFVGSPIPPTDVTLAIVCGNGGNSSGTLNQYTGGTPLGLLSAGAETDCHANATLSASSTANNQTVNPFEIDFVGTQT